MNQKGIPKEAKSGKSGMAYRAKLNRGKLGYLGWLTYLANRANWAYLFGLLEVNLFYSSPQSYRTSKLNGF